MMNRQIDSCKSEYVVNFDPRSKLTLDSAHARRIQPGKYAISSKNLKRNISETISPIESKFHNPAETSIFTSWVVCSYSWKIQYDWQSPSWKSLWCHNSTADGLIWTTFGRHMQNDMMVVTQTSESKPDAEWQHGRRLF